MEEKGAEGRHMDLVWSHPSLAQLAWAYFSLACPPHTVVSLPTTASLLPGAKGQLCGHTLPLIAASFYHPPHLHAELPCGELKLSAMGHG